MRAVAFAVTVLVAATAPALGADLVLQPGDQLLTKNLNGTVTACTLGFVFDGLGAKAGKVYFASAAHCFFVTGQAAYANDLEEPFGRVVHLDGLHDAALVEVDAAYSAAVSGEVLGRPGVPTGLASRGDVVAGDLLLFSGYVTGQELPEALRTGRVGALTGTTSRDWRGWAAIGPGDSGGPVVHGATGGALGLVGQIRAADVPGDAEPRMEGPLASALPAVWQAAGHAVRLRTA